MLQFLSRFRPQSSVVSRFLLLSSLALALWALLLAATGGVDLRNIGIRFSSRDELRPALLALVLVLVYLVKFRDDADARLTSLRAMSARWAPLLALGLAVYTLALGLKFGSFVAGGADSYGYLSQADLWLKGDLTIEQPLARELPWENADWTLSPLGYRPSLSGGAIVPTYAPGLAMLMAVATLGCGECGRYLVVPLLGALLVLVTYKLGEQVRSRNVGLAAAALMASSPAFVFMLMAPMSDVPIATFYVAALVIALSRIRARAFWTGLAVSGAILVRPNLVPIAAVFLVFLIVQEVGWRKPFWTVVAFGLGVLPSAVAIAIIHTRLYGAPWKSGYGDLESLYAWHFGVTNLVQYSQWLVSTQTPLILALVLPLVLLHRVERRQRAAFLFLGAFAGSVWLSYLFYIPFDAWWYLRFLLAAFPPMIVMAITGWDLAMIKVRPAYRALLIVCMTLGVIGYQFDRINGYATFTLWTGDSNYVSVGRYVDQALPKNAVLLSMQHSGSLRFYSGRLTLRYDWLAPEWWPRALDVLTAKGYRPYIVLADFEESQFRSRFGLSAAEDAPGTVVAELRQPVVRIYDPLRQTEARAHAPRIPVRIPHPCRWWN